MNTLIKAPLILILAAAAMAFPAKPKPNFTGTWELNPQKSDMGDAPATQVTVKIEHNEPVLKYSVKGTEGEEAFEESESFTLDGKPAQDSHGATVTAHWEGAALVIEGSDASGHPLFSARITLSDDGKTIVRDYERKGAAEPQKRHEIYEKR